MSWRWSVLVAFCTGCAALVPAVPGPEAGERAAIRRALRDLPEAVDERGRQRRAWLQAFYAGRGFEPAWTTPRGVQARADDLLGELGRMGDHGLDPETYGRAGLRRAVAALRAGGGGTTSGVVDVALSAAFLACADDLRRGAVDPAVAGLSWGVRPPASDLSGLLSTSIALDQVAANLRRLAPSQPEYRRLQKELASRAGSPGPEGDLLRVNLERWRWLPRDLGSRYLLVRIADFELDYVVDGRPQVFRVIVGEPFRQTPQFATEATHLLVHPAWNVPPRIADEELAPLLATAAGARRLRDQGFEARTVDGAGVGLDGLSWDPAAGLSAAVRLRQRPGAANPLGRVKLEMDNPYAVYLHDTPGTGLFARDDRDLSHGCVRVEDMVDLARRLLASDPAARRRFESLLAAGETGRVELPGPVPVYVLYWTASVTAAGDVRLAADAYDADRQVLQALEAARRAGPPVPLTGRRGT